MTIRPYGASPRKLVITAHRSTILCFDLVQTFILTMVNEALGCGVTRRRLLSLETGIINKWKLGKMIVNKTKMTLGNVRIPDLVLIFGSSVVTLPSYEK